MKNNYTKLFYQFLVEQGMLFDFLQMVSTTSHKTLKVHCQITNPKNYIYRAFIHSQRYDWEEVWEKLEIIWKEKLHRHNIKINKKKKK